MNLNEYVVILSLLLSLILVILLIIYLTKDEENKVKKMTMTIKPEDMEKIFQSFMNAKVKEDKKEKEILS